MYEGSVCLVIFLVDSVPGNADGQLDISLQRQELGLALD